MKGDFDVAGQGLTAYHAAVFAEELTARHPSDDPAKLGVSLLNASVDLNPHQVDAALFGFRSPLSRGAILADEVGLGKTIEAGLVISQLWAEHRRRILVVAPTILRKQWAQELFDKFHLPSQVVDAKEFNSRRKAGQVPFQPTNRVVIASYNFIWNKEEAVSAVPWDLVVIDEAHRLRNVWKSGNKIASSLLESVGQRPLLLLTATPLQNSLLELFGLVSFIDPHLFGSIEAFRARYMRGPVEGRELLELRRRLRPICQRTLRRQVQEYVRFTNRVPITQDFTPSDEEQRLYEMVSAYLQRDDLHALPSRQRALMTMILRKLLASSTFAISATLTTLADRLQTEAGITVEDIDEDYESADETEDEWTTELPPPDPNEIAGLQAEIEELRSYAKLAASITDNQKGLALLQALEKGFAEAERLGSPRKAVVFTESRRTQRYLMDLLAANGYEGRVLTINGVNADDRSGEIYREWRKRHEGEPVVSGNKSVDLRAALVEQFRDHADILIATEAASEGVNLQFCAFVCNFDLPWNPQRIEQRIGRCHRYGQTHDVVVVNFLNRKNEADRRVFELLSEKFQLFSGVFGASDEVLGALESGVDFERRIAEIYQFCRTTEEIDAAFDALRAELDGQVQARLADTRSKLLENFDEEVRAKLRVSQEGSVLTLNRLERALWNLTRFELDGEAEFDDEAMTAQIGERLLCMDRNAVGHAETYRLSDPVAEDVLSRARSRNLGVAELRFDLARHGAKVGLLEPWQGRSGWLEVRRLTIRAMDEHDVLLFAALDDGGGALLPEAARRLFELRAEACRPITSEPPETLAAEAGRLEVEAVRAADERNRRFFEEEIDKLERWADDLKHALEADLKDLDARIRDVSKEAKLAPSLEAKLELHREKKELEQRRNQKRRDLYEEQDKITDQKDELIDSVAAQLNATTGSIPVLRVRWTVV